METKVLSDKPASHPAFLGHLLWSCLVYLPLIAALASFTLVLDKFQAFRSFDDSVVAFAAPVRADPDDANAHFSVALISRDLFESDFGRVLPLDKSKLHEILRSLQAEEPIAVAIDIDAIPRDDKALDQQPMYTAITPLLQHGIHVVLLSYQHPAGGAESARVWRKAFCEAATKLSPTANKQLGKLWWASGSLDKEGQGFTTIRYLKPEQAIRRAEAGIDESLVPLGLVLPIASGQLNDPRLEALADHCGKPHHERRDTRLDADEVRKDLPEAFINYFNHRPAIFSLASRDWAASPLHPFRARAVVLGAQTFEGFDLHTTPVGQLPGAALHALIAATAGKPVHDSHLIAFCADVLAGYVFVVVFHLLQHFQETRRRAWPTARTVHRLLSVICPIVAFGLVLGCLLAVAPLAAAFDAWLNPVPMLVGLMAHLYVELIPEPGETPEHDPRHATAKWWQQLKDTGRNWTQVGALPTWKRVDIATWSVMQLAMFGLLAAAIHLLFNTGH